MNTGYQPQLRHIHTLLLMKPLRLLDAPATACAYVPPGSGTLCTGTAIITGSMPSSGGEGGSASGAGSGSGAGSWSVAGPVWRWRCLRLRLWWLSR